MEQRIKALREQMEQKIGQIDTKEKLAEFWQEFLGKKGAVADLMKGLGAVAKEDRPAMGKVINEFKVLVEEKVGEYAGGIIFPGGHVEEHEPIVDSVIREIKEETGLDIKNPTLCGVKDWINEDGSRYVVFLFRADRFSGQLASSAEGQVFWMEKDQVLKSNWIWHMDGLMSIMAEGRYSELFLDSADDWKAILK